MKRILLVFWLFILGAPIYCQTAEFIERVVSYRDGRNNYFIPIRVKSEQFTGEVIVENFNLFDYLRMARGFDATAYKPFALNLLKGKSELEMTGAKVDEAGMFLSGKNIKEHTFRIVVPSQAVETVSAKGCEQFIRYYFAPPLTETENQDKLSCKDRIRLNTKDLLMKPKYDLIEENNVIVRLFEMDIPTYVDDISGNLKIAYLILK